MLCILELVGDQFFNRQLSCFVVDEYRHISFVVDNHVVDVTTTELLSKWVIVLFSNNAFQVGVGQMRESSGL